MVTNAPTRSPKPCPICSKPSVKAFHPFCSARCADVDLGRWLKGNYVIPGKPIDQETDAATEFSEDEDN